MRVLVTGGLGFIGSTIAEHHIAAGDQVTIIDDLSSNVVSMLHFAGRAEVIAGPVERVLPTSAAIMAQRIIHCASPVGPAGILPLKGRIASSIVRSTEAVIDAATGAELVNISTSEVYGTSGVYRESDDLRVPAAVSPRIEYAVGKMTAEAMVRLTPGLRSVTIRPFNVAGHRQSSRGGFVLPTFAEHALRREPLPVYSGGQQRRALTSVDDVARLVVSHLPESIFDGRVLNAGNPANTTTILDLAGLVNELGSNSAGVRHTTGAIEHGSDYAEAEGHTKVPDITAARQLGWEPRVDLRDLIGNVLAEQRLAIPA